MRRLSLIPPLALLALLAVAPAGAAGPATLKLATTTSTVDTGLFDVLLPAFERRCGIAVRVLSVGTGKALKLAENGDVDVVLVHSRRAEEEFLAKGVGTNPVDVMHNDFVIAGPAADPAGVAATKTAAEAFAAIARAGAAFASRGDRSGTHDRELELWGRAGVATFGAWRLETGQGMGATLRLAGEKGAYLLADRATWLAQGAASGLKLLFEGGDDLLNRYRVIVVHPARHPRANYVEAMTFAGWITSPEGQGAIRDFRKNGRALFVPDFVK